MNNLTNLFERYYNKTATLAERQELMEIIDRSATDENIASLVKQAWDQLQQNESFFTTDESMAMLQKIINPQLKTARLISMKKFWSRIAVAASILLFLGAGYWWFESKNSKVKIEKEVAVKNDVKAPATNRAMITLANGQKVYLDNANNGQLAIQGNVKLVKLTNGQIAYQTANGGAVKKIQYNTLFNPRGSKVIDLGLSDGSHVWLNAGSSITYPIAMVGSERKVEVTGEAYFDVVHDESKPFIVKNLATNVEVQVLGTEFNVNSYDDEDAVRVTLIKGSVKILRSTQSDKPVTIKPGQQAVATDKINVASNIDLDEVMAWRNNLFVFNGVKIQAVLRQLSRWYDVDVRYSGNITNDDFVGMVSRSENISQVLKMMESTKKVRFEIQGKTITVTSP